MTPINKAERRKAFLSFLLFFLITIVVIISTLLFSFQVPFKENDKLRKEMDLAANEKDFLKSFEVKVHETMNLLDSINLVENDFIINNDIDNKIKSMAAMLNDSIAVNGLCSKILYNLKDLQTAKQQLRKVNFNSAEIERKDTKIEKLESDLKTCEGHLVQCYMKQNQK